MLEVKLKSMQQENEGKDMIVEEPRDRAPAQGWSHFPAGPQDRFRYKSGVLQFQQLNRYRPNHQQSKLKSKKNQKKIWKMQIIKNEKYSSLQEIGRKGNFSRFCDDVKPVVLPKLMRNNISGNIFGTTSMTMLKTVPFVQVEPKVVRGGVLWQFRARLRFRHF